jgi:hypothetical protein
MTPGDWQRSSVYLDASALRLEDRAAYLDQACMGEFGTAVEVESLLEADVQARPVLNFRRPFSLPTC